jgi:hypothetical protein
MDKKEFEAVTKAMGVVAAEFGAQSEVLFWATWAALVDQGALNKRDIGRILDAADAKLASDASRSMITDLRRRLPEA